MRSLGWLFCFLWPVIAGAQDRQVFHSEYLNRPDTVWIFTPADYDNSSGQRFPVVYLLHGWSGYYSNWDEIIGCQAYADQYGFILVCPDGLYDSWYLNSPVKGENRYEDFFIRELMPYLTNQYRVQPDGTFITGLSMGGYGALYLFSRYDSLFRSAGSLSGLLDLQDWQDHYGISRVLGLVAGDEKNPRTPTAADDGLILRKFSVTGNMEGLVNANKEIIVSCGTEDPFYSINLAFKKLCRKKRIRISFITAPGSHNSDYWSKAIGDHFDFFRDLLKN